MELIKSLYITMIIPIHQIHANHNNLKQVITINEMSNPKVQLHMKFMQAQVDHRQVWLRRIMYSAKCRSPILYPQILLT